VRIALGASPAGIVRMVVRQGAASALIGIGVGLLAAVGLSRLLDGLLYQVSPTDPASFAAMAALVLAIALAASYLPASRAGRIDPARVLRAE
jgi:putative ABC transport system permease protein